LPRLATIGHDFYEFAGVFNQEPAFTSLRRGKRMKEGADPSEK
jgi:hypothetical protein